MDVRSADPDDRHRVRDIAHDSFESSYSISPDQIETLLETAFSSEALSDRIDDPDVLFYVAEHDVDGEHGVFGFIDVELGSDGTIRWLHVDPDARGDGIGTALVDRVRGELADRGLPLAARVLVDAVEGSEFCERFGLERSGNDRFEVGDEEFTVAVLAAEPRTAGAYEPSVTVPDTVRVDGATRSVDRDDPVPGRNAPFFRLYTGGRGGDPYGYFCSQCGSTDVAADGLDRLECNTCGNVHLADRWDDAYL